MPVDSHREWVEHQTLAKLDAQEPTNKDLAEGIKMIYASLWDKKALDKHIRDIHNSLCADCSQKQGKKDVLLKWSGWIILALLAIVGKLVGVEIPAVFK